jgi:hypothetical protein
VPGIGKVADLPFVTQVLQGILPTIGEWGHKYALACMARLIQVPTAGANLRTRCQWVPPFSPLLQPALPASLCAYAQRAQWLQQLLLPWGLRCILQAACAAGQVQGSEGRSRWCLYCTAAVTCVSSASTRLHDQPLLLLLLLLLCVPPAVLKVFLILIPPILGMMARFEGKVSLSEVDFSIGEQQQQQQLSQQQLSQQQQQQQQQLSQQQQQQQGISFDATVNSSTDKEVASPHLQVALC